MDNERGKQTKWKCVEFMKDCRGFHSQERVEGKEKEKKRGRREEK